MTSRNTINRLLQTLSSLTAVFCVLAAGTAAASSVVPCPQQFGSFSATNEPPACWRPYGPGSPFNRELPPNPRISPESAAIVTDMRQLGYHFEGGASKFAFISPGRGAIYYSQASDPLVTVHCTAQWGPGTCQGANGVSVDGIQIPVPAGAQPQGGIDHHFVVIDQASNLEYDFEQASWSSDHGTLTVAGGGETQIGPDQGTGLDVPGTAASFSAMAGLIRGPELAAGSINHALVVSIPCTEGATWPAQGPWGFACSQLGQSPKPGAAAPRMGTLLALDMTDAEIAASGAPAWEQTLMTAMAHYGMYVNDTNGQGDPNTIEIEKQSDVSFTSLGGRPEMAQLLKSLGASYWAPSDRWIVSGPAIDVSRLRVIDPCVARRSCSGAARGRSTRAHVADGIWSCRRAAEHRPQRSREKLGHRGSCARPRTNGHSSAGH